MSDFLALSQGEIISRLSIAYANRGFTRQFTDQTLTWERDIHSLREALAECVEHDPTAEEWGILLEFSIPRKELRIDAVLLIGADIVIIEGKSGTALFQARRQLEEYALLLRYFHKSSEDRRIVPLVVSPEAGQPDLDPLKQCEMFPQLSTFWVSKPTLTS
ncbi:MAG: hypothetical protein ACLPTQ_06250 [Terriglobales bacterium]